MRLWGVFFGDTSGIIIFTNQIWTIEYRNCTFQNVLILIIPISYFYFIFFAVNGYKEVAFHVQRDVSSYTRSYIHHVIKTVAVIIECKEEDILFNGVRHSERFMLSLSVKEVYSGKLLALREKDRTKLRRLNIAYLIIDGERIHIERSKGK